MCAISHWHSTGYHFIFVITITGISKKLEEKVAQGTEKLQSANWRYRGELIEFKKNLGPTTTYSDKLDGNSRSGQWCYYLHQ